MGKIKLEVFESNTEILPITFYVYDVVSFEQSSNKQQLMRSIVRIKSSTFFF